MNQKEFQHLMNRAGFGCVLEEAIAGQSKSREKIIKQLFTESSEPTELSMVKRLEVEDIMDDMRQASGDSKKDYRKMLYDIGRTMNGEWLRKMMTDKAQLAEKMTFFWHGHFACRDDNPALLQLLNNVIRNNSLGKFKDLLIAVSQSPAMLKFLNNEQNKKNAPNENFAREVMELFTLGRANYTEKDVKEAARAFTGWTFERITLNFRFNQNQHDFGEKEFLGKKGNFEGGDIIDMILYKEECAQFITGKIYQFFVNEVRDEERIKSLAEKFYANDYDIPTLMYEIFSSDWFYEEKNIAAKIKSPVELLVNISRLLSVEYGNEETLVYIQKLLGQTLFMPPNVAGWPVGKRWIDSTSLIFRMSLGKKIIESAELNERLKADDDTDPNMLFQKQQKQKKGKLNEIDAKINWEALSKPVNASSDGELFNCLSTALLSTGNVNYSNAGFTIQGETKEQKVKSIVAHIMSYPEFQLC